MRSTSSLREKPRACRRCTRFSKKAATRSSARMPPSSSITPCSRTISRLMMRCTWCCSAPIWRDSSPTRSNGMTQTSASSRATASQVWWSFTMPSSPMISPAIWKPVTWSRPSSDVTQVLKKPVRMANSELKASPLRNSAPPRLILRRVATTSSRRCSSSGLRPTGMHSSRRLQLEQATLMVCRSAGRLAGEGTSFNGTFGTGVSLGCGVRLIYIKLSRAIGWRI